MTRKFIIVLVITTLFTALVVGFSWIYLSQFLRQRLLWADETASQLTNQLEYAASKAVPDLTSTRVNTENPKAMRAAITNYLQTDTNLNDMLESVVGNSRIIYDAAIIDPNGVAILDTNPALNGKPIPQRPPLSVLRDAGFRRQLRTALRPRHRLRRQQRNGTRRARVWQRPRWSLDGFSAQRIDAETPAGSLLFRGRDFLFSGAGGGGFERRAGTLKGHQPQPRQRQRRRCAARGGIQFARTRSAWCR